MASVRVHFSITYIIIYTYIYIYIGRLLLCERERKWEREKKMCELGNVNI